jgi:hypothetical protein
MATVGFPIITIFNESGTFTEETKFPNLDATNQRSLLAGLSVTSLTGGTGVSMSIQGKGADGLYYELGRINNLDVQGVVTISGPIPETLQVQLDLIGGATSATLTMWIYGQA